MSALGDRLRGALERAINETLPERGERAAYVEAIQSIADYLWRDDLVKGQKGCMWLFDLALALQEHGNGAIRPWLETERTNLRKTHEWGYRVYVALCVKALVLSGDNKSDAADKVVREIKSRCWLGSKKEVLSWYERFSKRGRIKNVGASRVFRMESEFLKNCAEPRQQLPRLLRLAERSVARLAGDKAPYS